MVLDDEAEVSIRTLIEQTYTAMSTPGSNFADFFGADDIAIAGSGLDELWTGPESAIGAATVVSS